MPSEVLKNLFLFLLCLLLVSTIISLSSSIAVWKGMGLMQASMKHLEQLLVLSGFCDAARSDCRSKSIVIHS